MNRLALLLLILPFFALGASLPNVTDVFQGSAPDLGAQERGAAAPHYGPRTGSQLTEHATYWALH